MAKSKSQTLPSFGSVKEAAAFFETHDMGDYWDAMPEAAFDVDIKHRRYLVPIDEKLLGKLAAIAKSKRVSTESLINSWLREKAIRTS